MPQSHSHVLIHIVFSTKDRRPTLQSTEHRAKVYESLSQTSIHLECPIVTIGGVADHVHLLGRMSRKISLADWIRDIKRVSSMDAKQLSPDLRSFSWQAGYGAFSVSCSNEETVSRYIQNQETHHRRKDFKDEFRTLCRKHKIEIDERYVWD